MMRVQPLQSEEFHGNAAELAQGWNQLAGDHPFLSWDWQQAWWRHYGAVDRADSVRLWLPAVFDESGRLAGLAPWYQETSSWQGRVVRFLGTGEVCSDYLGVLARPGTEAEVAHTLAAWLVEQAKADWDVIDLDGVDAENLALRHLAADMKAGDCLVSARSGPSCWRIELPASWEQYLSRLSKSHRKQVHRLDRLLCGSGRVVVRTVETERDLCLGEDILVQLHQKRQMALGNSGCFASPRFRAFHSEQMRQLLYQRRLWLFWIELDGRPIAVEYAVVAGGVVYCYQGGIEPDVARQSPGQLATVAAIKLAIERGYGALDFLRGDEPYKAHWRASPRPSLRLRIAAPHASAQLRHGVWCAARTIKDQLAGLAFD